MKCRGKFKFKGLQEKSGGEFINGRGEKVSYKPSYVIKLDEQTDDGIFERNFKIALDSQLVSVLSQVQLYQDIELEFDVLIYGTNVKIIPVNLINSK